MGEEDIKKPFQHTFASIIDGVHTDIVCHKFENKIFLLITQYEKMPNVIIVKKHTVFNNTNNAKSLSIQHKFGTDNEEITATIKYLMANTGLSNVELDIIFSLGLKKVNKTVVKEIAEVLKCIEF